MLAWVYPGDVGFQVYGAERTSGTLVRRKLRRAGVHACRFQNKEEPMPRTKDFEKRVGKVFIPVADDVAIDDDAEFQVFSPTGSPAIRSMRWFRSLSPFSRERIEQANPNGGFKYCRTDLREGCYWLRFVPNDISPVLLGTIRVENRFPSGAPRNRIRFSGDLYAADYIKIERGPRIPGTDLPEEGRRNQIVVIGGGEQIHLPIPTGAADTSRVIPIYPRRSYRSYLKGTHAALLDVVPVGDRCSFSLTFSEFVYQHPATGFNGSFQSTPSRTIEFLLSPTGTADTYSGTAFNGTTELGGVSMQWISPSFRRARLKIYNLMGAQSPQPVGTDNFQAIFATAGWDLHVALPPPYDGQIPLPPTLLGVQDPNQCWEDDANSAELMASVPGYDPTGTVLDRDWQVYLLAVPAKADCEFGKMFDSITVMGAIGSTGDPNQIPREGVRTCSNATYRPQLSPNFGTAANQPQNAVPRAFLRSAAHEVGHAFNQFHPDEEAPTIVSGGPGGFPIASIGLSDNSIMSHTPGVANALAAQSLTFPAGIRLAFNSTSRHRLIHQPDPYVRPGAMEFSGLAASAPSDADQVAWLRELALILETDDHPIKLGEPLPLNWTLVNKGDAPVLVPSHLDVESLTARVSVTDSNDRVDFPPACGAGHLRVESPSGVGSEGVAERLHYSVLGPRRLRLRTAWLAPSRGNPTLAGAPGLRGRPCRD